MEIKVFVSNLGLYNDGIINGEWKSLPVKDVHRDILDKIIQKDEKGLYINDFIISDYEAPFEIDQYENLEALNNLAKALENYETIKNVYDELDDRDRFAFSEVYSFEDPEEFINNSFSSPYEAAMAVGRWHVNLNDDYVYFNGYGNLETISEAEYLKKINENATEIIEEFRLENQI